MGSHYYNSKNLKIVFRQQVKGFSNSGDSSTKLNSGWIFYLLWKK